MNAVENDVRALVDKELAAAHERFPQFHSAHEGWAVIREEADELSSEIAYLEGYLLSLWNYTKNNRPDECRNAAKSVYTFAIHAACEAIQVAAMCKKFGEINHAVTGTIWDEKEKP